MVAIHHVERFLSDLHGDIDNVFDPALIHDRENVLRLHGVEMVVIVDHRKTGALHSMYLAL